MTPFSFHDDIASYALPWVKWRELNDKNCPGIVAVALIYNTNPQAQDRVLLLRRVAHDYLGERWEPPGGTMDADDESILHACTRELREEAGLTATSFVCVVSPGFDWIHDNGVRRVFFLARVKEGEQVKIDPEEHTEYTWVTQEEVRDERMASGREMPVTSSGVKQAILEGFRKNGTKGK